MLRTTFAAVVLASLLAASPALADETGRAPSSDDTVQPVHDTSREGEVGAPPVNEAAATVPVRERTITINPLALAFGSLQAELEQAVSPGMSWFVGPGFAFASAGDASAIAVGLTGGARFFVSGKGAPAGLWVGPQANVLYISATSSSTSMGGIGYGIGGLLGYTWAFDSAFVLSLGGGLQFTNTEIELERESVGVSGIGPAARLSLGWAF